MPNPTCVKPNLGELMPLYSDILTRSKLKQLLLAQGVTLYWRIFTPLMTLWGMIYQRLSDDKTCDAVISYFKSGAADAMDTHSSHPSPLSQRFKSESTSAYVQARNRLPVGVVHTCLRWVFQWVWSYAFDANRPAAPSPAWHGRAVRLLDGTTYRMRPEGDLVAHYGQPKNQKGLSDWVVAKSVAAFCLDTRLCIGVTEGPQTTSEPALACALIPKDPLPESVYVGDRLFGVYRVAQVAHAHGHDLVVRLEVRTAKRLLRASGKSPSPSSGTGVVVAWYPTSNTTVEPNLPKTPIVGRLGYVQLQKNGFRSIDISLFTTLLDETVIPLADLFALYGLRWQVELNYRDIKTTLDMASFNVQSASMFQRELAVGLLTYNFICAFMMKAANQAGRKVTELSFIRCLRRIRDALTRGMPAWVLVQSTVSEYLLYQLAKCTLKKQRHKAAHEPRAVRGQPRTYPLLEGDREVARNQLLAQMTENLKS